VSTYVRAGGRKLTDLALLNIRQTKAVLASQSGEGLLDFGLGDKRDHPVDPVLPGEGGIDSVCCVPDLVEGEGGEVVGDGGARGRLAEAFGPELADLVDKVGKFDVAGGGFDLMGKDAKGRRDGGSSTALVLLNAAITIWPLLLAR
jgi:hypothetical protein